MNSRSDPLQAAIEALDRSIEGLAGPVWVGAEPTFTLRDAETPEWLSEPLGGDKQRLARRLIGKLRTAHAGAVLMRTLGRQYADEDAPRWSLGLYQPRNGGSLWAGPPDPLEDDTPSCDPERLLSFCARLSADLGAAGWPVLRPDGASGPAQRLVFRVDGQPLTAADAGDPRWRRESVHDRPVPQTGLADDLAADGFYLLRVEPFATEAGVASIAVELPEFSEVGVFCRFLEILAAAASELPSLVLRGFPPPVDASVAWTTVTPDPAVIEINQAPYADSASFYAASRELYRVAEEAGLSPYRLQYTGEVGDSGGGGQFTLGGPSAEQSPFVRSPQLLPRLVRYVLRHPSLSYWFAPDYLGGSSQSPRPDEGVRDLFRELPLALAQLAATAAPDPEFVWRSLAPFLADPSGNSHRSELNIEKLWNPYLPGRGCLGLVEFRAFRMATSAERAAAISLLLRSIVAMLLRDDLVPDITDWGDRLHERFALPYYLRLDLLAVLADLAAAGLPFADPLQRLLLDDGGHRVWELDFADCRLRLERALDFWPLVGDVASQESGGSRLVDASTHRWQLLLRPAAPDVTRPLSGWRLCVGDTPVPLRQEGGSDDPVRLLGLRLRAFQPWRGLHPGVAPAMPLRLALSHPELTEALQIELHDWQPQGLPYAGLPGDLAEARRRRQERLVVSRVAAEDLAPARAAPPGALSDYTLDLRWTSMADDR